ADASTGSIAAPRTKAPISAIVLTVACLGIRPPLDAASPVSSEPAWSNCRSSNGRRLLILDQRRRTLLAINRDGLIRPWSDRWSRAYRQRRRENGVSLCTSGQFSS